VDTPVIKKLTMKPQSRAVLEYLKSGKGLSNLIALNTLGVGSLSSRISELKRLGYDIEATSHKNPLGKRYNVYHLVGASK
jgi:hypothetical protein